LLVSAASLVIGWTAATVAASSGPRGIPAASAPADRAALLGTELGAPAADHVSGQLDAGAPEAVVGSAGSSGASTGIAYPYQIGPSLGVAPEKTILVAGTGTADMKADGSNRAAATAKAAGLALDDARAQAAAVAKAMGVSLAGIYSVSASSYDNGIYPISECAVPMPALSGADSSGTTSGGQGTATVTAPPAPAHSPDVCTTKPAGPTATQVVVTLVVAYRFA